MDLYEIETPENKAVRRFAWKLDDAKKEAGRLTDCGYKVLIKQNGVTIEEYSPLQFLGVSELIINEQKRFMTEHQGDNMTN